MEAFSFSPRTCQNNTVNKLYKTLLPNLAYIIFHVMLLPCSFCRGNPHQFLKLARAFANTSQGAFDRFVGLFDCSTKHERNANFLE
jgi:hypothetical protein